ncbi:glutamate 5-kinase [Alteromonas sp. a30]|uniref:glutamate 5-kinase n=1 Tax=Alteromonas sp. a30 TaxID=2730917 RepID=UPI00227E9238|nr:glutamate 5-kinase [Alteromonas sp. a30]MCY7295240.1 glutamate 5-kinase [Alteromonas sp. a30]
MNQTTSDKQTIVIKVGSTLIAPNGRVDRKTCLPAISSYINQCFEQGIRVVLVSSGSVAAGKHFFSNETPSAIEKKAMAATGQSEMIATWDSLLHKPCAQILLTQADLQERTRYTNIKSTVNQLLDNGIIPIVNENDAVTSGQFEVGDNDNLSAMIAACIHADTLIICTDIDGLYDKNPHTHDDAQLIKEVKTITPEILKMAGGSNSNVGTGGMITKLQAAQKATEHGIDTIIVNGKKKESFEALFEKVNPGTFFEAQGKPLQDQTHWLIHTSKAVGELIIKEEEDNKIAVNARNLDFRDIVEVNGEFAAGDTVLIKDVKGKKIAKATSLCSSCLLNFVNDHQDENTIMESALKQGPIIQKTELAIFAPTL